MNIANKLDANLINKIVEVGLNKLLGTNEDSNPDYTDYKAFKQIRDGFFKRILEESAAEVARKFGVKVSPETEHILS